MLVCLFSRLSVTHLQLRSSGVECVCVQYLERAVAPLAGDLGSVLSLELVPGVREPVPCCCTRGLCEAESDRTVQIISRQQTALRGPPAATRAFKGVSSARTSTYLCRERSSTPPCSPLAQHLHPLRPRPLVPISSQTPYQRSYLPSPQRLPSRS